MRFRLIAIFLTFLLCFSSTEANNIPLQLFNRFSQGHLETVIFKGCTDGVTATSDKFTVYANTKPHTVLTLITAKPIGNTTCFFAVNDAQTMGDQMATVADNFNYQPGFIYDQSFDVTYPNNQSNNEVWGGAAIGPEPDYFYLGIK